MKTTTPAPAHFASRPIYSEFFPLDEFYAAHGAKPDIERVEAGEIPAPYRALLDHKTDMTSTLEKFHGEPLHIQALERHLRENIYYRQVVLVLNRSKKRVEFGAIKIILNLFPVEAQDEILREHQPMGRILSAYNIAFTSRPSAFLRLQSDPFIEKALQLQTSGALYGRRNSLLDAWERSIAEIVEILPP